MTTFYLVRHAHADWTPDENRPLSIQGYEAAIRVANILQGYPIDMICSSPFYRAHQTVAPLAARLGLSIQVEPDLQERRLGSSADEDFFGAAEATRQDHSRAHLEGETNATAQQRGLSVLHRLQEQHTAEHIVLSTHGNLMALILQAFDASVDFSFWKSLTTPDIYQFTIGRDGETHIDRLWKEQSMNSDLATYTAKAIEWAKAQMGSDAYTFRCLAFVEDAYEIANRIEIFGGSTAKESADEYGAQQESSMPSPGTFVFYDNSGTLFDTYKNWGHVGLSLGDGKVIHAWDKVRIDGYLDVEKLQGAAGWTQPRYIGWTPIERVFQGHRKKTQDEQ